MCNRVTNHGDMSTFSRPEWEGEKRGRYEEEWGHQMEMGGNMVIEYNIVIMRVYKKIPDHLMRDLKLSEGTMWRRSDGMFVAI